MFFVYRQRGRISILRWVQFPFRSVKQTPEQRGSRRLHYLANSTLPGKFYIAWHSTLPDVLHYLANSTLPGNSALPDALHCLASSALPNVLHCLVSSTLPDIQHCLTSSALREWGISNCVNLALDQHTQPHPGIPGKSSICGLQKPADALSHRSSQRWAPGCSSNNRTVHELYSIELPGWPPEQGKHARGCKKLMNDGIGRSSPMRNE